MSSTDNPLTRRSGLNYSERFRVRACPLCGNERNSVAFDLEAADFCKVNWTYVTEFRSVLNLPAVARFPIDRCESCSFLFARYLPSQGFLSQVYEEVIRIMDCRAGSENPESRSHRLRYLAVLLETAAAQGRRPLTALDFGAGIGVTLRLLDACGLEAWGVDPSQSRAAHAATAGIRVVSSIEEVGAEKSFDLLICDNVLEHLPDPVGALKALGGMVVEGGLAYVSVPDYGPSRVESQSTALAIGRAIDMTLNPWEHLNYFDLPHLDRLLSVGGFRRIHASLLAGPVQIGLRPEGSAGARLKNALASLLRLGKYAWTGRGVETTEFAFYRKVE